VTDETAELRAALRPLGADGMRDGEKAPIILVAANENLFNNIREALANNFALLHASTKREAIALLERLRSEIKIAIVELEVPDSGAWTLIGQLARHPRKPVKLIATTSLYPERVLGKVKELGIDAVVPIAIPPEEWRRTIEKVLGKHTR
jgi:PleD family two-component response regulator